MGIKPMFSERTASAHNSRLLPQSPIKYLKQFQYLYSYFCILGLRVNGKAESSSRCLELRDKHKDAAFHHPSSQRCRMTELF